MKKSLFIFALLIAPLLFGNVGEAGSPPPSRTPRPTHTPRPTRPLPTPSATHTPTTAPTMTATMEPTATAVPPTVTPTPPGDCDWPWDTPAGSLPSQLPPVFCLITNSGPGTEQPGPNSWFDDFNHGLSLADFDGTGYQVFDEIGAWRTISWRHNDHWMVDLAPHPPEGGWGWNIGMTMMRPNQSFHFENGMLVVETIVAAGHLAYNDQAWPEITISGGPAPWPDRVSIYGYDQFPEFWTIGCRINSSRVPICALKADDGQGGQGSTRIWEMSFWQLVGTYNFGGGPFGELDDYWSVCELDEPDTACQDLFRLELTATRLSLFVNGHLYFEQGGIPPLPDELLNGDLYVYLVSNHGEHTADTIRYHWDDFSVNNYED